MRRRWIACVVGAIVLAACSGGDDDASSTTSAADPTVASAAPTTAAPEPAPTDPPATTSAPATTAPPVETTEADIETTEPPATTAPETTESETTTTQPRVTEEQLAEFRASVEADWREGNERWLAAVAQPDDSALVDAAFTYATSAVLEGRQRTIDSLVEQNRRAIESDEVPITFTIVEGPDAVDDLTAEARLVYCTVDSIVVLERGDDGTETVVSDGVSTKRWSALLRWNGEIWRIASLEQLDSQEGVGRCE